MREIQVQQAAGPRAHGYVVKQEVVTDGKGWRLGLGAAF